MNELPNNGDSPLFPFTRIGFPEGFEVCWAGPNPLQPGFCFGSLDGRLLLTDEQGRTSLPPLRGSASGEAINGVARVGSWLTVSTRQEVSVWPLLGGADGPNTGLVLPYGAHDITTTPSGYLVASLGLAGIMAVRPPFTPENPIKVHSAEKQDLYVYRLICLRSKSGTEVLACAARLGGIAAGEFSDSPQKLDLNRATFAGLDVVDVYPLDPDTDSLAIGALGRDGTVILSRDVLHDRAPVTAKAAGEPGIAYRLVSCRGDVYVLTSKGIYVLGKLAERFLAGELTSGTTTPVLALPMEAADLELVDNRWLLAVTPTEVYKVEVDAIQNA
jgi:hypothetical protein